MQTIKYTFADGTTSTVEVSDELHAVHLEIVQQEKRNHWRETRRHTSLYYLMENGIDFEDRRSDSPLESYIRKENITSIRKAISMLTPKRQELIYKVFFLGKSFSAIAKETGVSKSAVSRQMQTVYKHLCKFLGEKELYQVVAYIALRNKDGSPMISVPLYVKVTEINKNGMTDAQESVMHRISEIMLKQYDKQISGYIANLKAE